MLVLRDTRESGPMLESAIAAGIAQAGGDALVAGVLPTPGASILVRRLGLDLAAVISASHNPWHDNGIKFFGPDGRKLDDAAEARIEELVRAARRAARARANEHRRRARSASSTAASTTTCASSSAPSASTCPGRRIVLDCANGSTHRAAPAIFARLGADVDAVATEPDGRNINDGCGSTHPEALAERVVDVRAPRSASPSTATATA